jgi:two-component system response regulator DesR
VLRRSLTQDGPSGAEIAARLHLAQGTVRNCLSDALAEPGVATRDAAAPEARAHGWI